MLTMARTTPDPIYTLRKTMSAVNCMLLSVEKSGQELLYVGTIHGSLHVWDLKIRRELRVLKICDNECQAILRYGNLFVIQERGGCFKYWRVDEGSEWQLVRSVKCDYNGFCRIALTDDGVLSPSDNGIVVLHQDTGSTTICEPLQGELSHKRGEVMCMKYLSSRKALLVAHECGTLSVWSFIVGTTPVFHSEWSFKDTPICVDYCEVTREGVLGTTGDSLKKFVIEDAVREVGNSTLTNPGVACVAVRQDGKLVVAGCWDGKIRYFSMKRLSLLAVLDHHSQQSVECVMFCEQCLVSCAAGTLFAAGRDGRISIWDLYTSRQQPN